MPACGVEAPHGRQRLFFVADASRERIRPDARGDRASQGQGSGEGVQRERRRDDGRDDGADGGVLADASRGRQQEHAQRDCETVGSQRSASPRRDAVRRGDDGGMGDALCAGRQRARCEGPRRRPIAAKPGWDDYELVRCVEPTATGQWVERWRRVEPGTFPLVDGVPGRVGRLRGYGNAIVPQVGAAFVRAFLEAEQEMNVRH